MNPNALVTSEDVKVIAPVLVLNEVTPPPDPLDAAVIRPFESTVMFAFVYEPAVTAVFANVPVPVTFAEPLNDPLV